MRYLRYVDYPKQARHYCATDVDAEDVVHVLDHGYAHLMDSVQNSSGSSAHSIGPKTCITVHDLIPILAWRGRFGREHAGRRPRLALYSAKHLASATKLFAVSSNTANDLHAEFDIPMNRIEVVPAPLDTGFVRSSEFEISEFRKNNDISSEYFWILVSGNEFYKNHSVVVSTFNKLKSEGLPVKILKTGMKSLPVSSPLSVLDTQDVKCVSVDSTELSTLYSSVDCLLFPSIYEGFGYPVVEALACSTPVICSQAASLPEVGGELAMFYASDDFNGMAEGIKQVLRGELGRDLARAGPEWVERFRAPRIAQQLFEHYQAL